MIPENIRSGPKAEPGKEYEKQRISEKKNRIIDPVYFI